MALKAPGIRPLKAPVVLDGFHMYPITLQFMTHPVMDVTTGHSYQQSTVRKLVKRNMKSWSLARLFCSHRAWILHHAEFLDLEHITICFTLGHLRIESQNPDVGGRIRADDFVNHSQYGLKHDCVWDGANFHENFTTNIQCKSTRTGPIRLPLASDVELHVVGDDRDLSAVAKWIQTGFNLEEVHTQTALVLDLIWGARWIGWPSSQVPL